MASSLGGRMAFNKATEAINRAGFTVGQAVLSQGYVRTEQVLKSGKSLYNFPILQNDSSQGSITNTEQRLALQDALYCSSFGVFLSKTTSTGVDILQTYNDVKVFTGGTSGADAIALGAVYNSFLSITTNNRQIVPAYDLSRHYVVKTSQTSSAAATASTMTNESSLSTDGFYPIEPGWVLVGSKNTQIQVTLPTGMTLSSDTAYKLVLVFRGNLGQNITPVR
jgi:hypothetical protein